MTLKLPSEIDLKHSKLFRRSDGIVEVTGIDHTYSVSDIKDINKAIGEITGNKKTLLLCVSSNYSEVDSEARHFMSTPEATVYSIAEAYVIKSLAQRLILNFIIKVTGTDAPVRFFTDKESSIEWLMSHNQSKEKNKNKDPHFETLLS